MPASLPGLPPAADLLPALLDLSVAGTVYYQPVRDAAGELVDLAFAYLNPAAQRLLGLPARPGTTYRQQFPGAEMAGLWEFHREALLAGGEVRQLHRYYQADGFDNFYQVAAREVGGGLLVSLSDSGEAAGPAGRQALRDSETRAQAARAEVARQQLLLSQLVEHAPMPLALFRGGRYVVELANPALAELWGRPLGQVLGRPVFEALPDLRDQGFEEILAGVLRTGEMFLGQEVPAVLARGHLGQSALGYFNVSYQSLPGQAEPTIIASAVEVTTQVLARQQVERLNHELEARVAERTGELAEQQTLLRRILGQVPAAIATLSGPEHRFSFFNSDYQAIVAGRAVLGLPLVEAVPEVVEQGFVGLLDQVYATQEPFVSRGVAAQLLDPATDQLTQHYVDLSYQALLDEQGQSTGVLAFVVDVTEGVLARRQADAMQAALLAAAQRQLRQREELYQVFEQAPAAIVLLREPDHRVEYVNPAFQQLFAGVSLRGRLLGEALPQAAPAATIADLDRVYQTGEPFRGEEQTLHVAPAPGQPTQPRHFNFTYQAYREDGRIVGVTVFAYDVTEAVQARRAASEELLRQQQLLETRVQERTREVQAARAEAERQRALLQELLAQAPVAIALYQGPDLTVVAANARIGELWGRLPADVLGRPLLEGVPELAGQGFDQLLRQVLATGVPYVGTEAPATMLRGGELKTTYYNYVYQPLYNAAGELLGVINVATEVTEQIAARRRIEELAAEAEAARAEAERERTQLQALLAQAPVAIALFQGPATRVASANERMAALWGRTPAQVVGKTLLEAVPELAGQGFDEMTQAVRATGVPYVGTEAPATILMEGRPAVRYYNFTCQPVYDAEGGLLGVLNVGTEVTEQVGSRRRIEELAAEAEAARAEAERQRGELERVFEQAPVAIAVYRGPTYTIQLANPTVARLWGRTREQLLGKGLFEALPEVAGMGFEQLLDGVMATGEPYVAHAMEAKHERNGRLETVYWDFVYVPTYAADGRIDGAMVVATEVTEQVQARQQVEQLNQTLEARVQERTRQLSEQQALLSRILGQVPASIATLSGPEHRYSFFNELYQQLVGARAALGVSVAEALPEVVEQGFIGLLDQVYATGEPFVGTDVPALLTDDRGEPRQYYVDFIYQPLFDAQQRVQGILAFIVDATDRARARQQAEQSRQQVQALNQELTATNHELTTTNHELHDSNARLLRTNNDLDTFVYTASHDLKAPITNIEGLLLALRDYLPTDGAEPMIPQLLGLMEKSVARFLQTINQLTDVSRLQNATREAAEPVDLAGLVENIRLDLAPQLASTQGQLLVEVAACPTVFFSLKNLRSILYNLLSNALKYRSPDRPPVVRLQASCLPGHVVLTVQDNGLGLSAAQQAKLFTLFQRLHTHVEGSGVGLYMLKRIVENADGTIAVQSEPGQGSTFTVTLPQRA